MRAERRGPRPAVAGWGAGARLTAAGLAAVLAVACQATAAPPARTTAVPTLPPASPAAPVAGRSAAGLDPPSDPVARGEIIFQETAGGFGCQFCHGKDAAGLVGPDIRGKPASAIRNALASVEAMRIVTTRTPLTPEDIDAVEKYLASLAAR